LSREETQSFGFDGSSYMHLDRLPPRVGGVRNQRFVYYYRKLVSKPNVWKYRKAVPLLLKQEPLALNEYPTVIPNFDNTPRAGARGLVIHETTPELFRIYFRKALQSVQDKPAQQRFLFIRSWNEWSEGNYLEPDTRFGRAFLEVIKEESLNQDEPAKSSVFERYSLDRPRGTDVVTPWP